MRDRGVVLQLVTVFRAADQAFGIFSFCKCSLDLNGRACAHGNLVIGVALKLEAGFVHDLRADDLSVTDLKGMLRLIRIGRLLWQ